MRRILSILLVICMMISMMPLTALADDGTEDGHDHSTAQNTLEETIPETTEEMVSETTEAKEPVTEPTVPETTEAVEEAEPEVVCTCESDDPAFHATFCAIYEAPAEPQCFCAEKCTEPNPWCDICGFDISRCGGEDTAVTYDGPCTHSVTATLTCQYDNNPLDAIPNTEQHERAMYLLDGDPSTKWCGVVKGYENFVVFTASDNYSIITSYTLTTGADTGTEGRYMRNWTDWTLYGSKNLYEDWVVIDQVKGASLPRGSNEVSDPFYVKPHTRYRYYKLVVDGIVASATSHQMADITVQRSTLIEGVCTECGAPCPHEAWKDGKCIICSAPCPHGDWANGRCSACGTPCPHENTLDLIYLMSSNGNDNEAASNLFDGDDVTKWCYTFGNDETYVLFTAGEATILKSLKLTIANDTADYPERNWKDWTLYGSNSYEGEWTKIQDVHNADLPVEQYAKSRDFMVAAHEPYTYYKLVVNNIKGGNTQQMAGMTVTGSWFQDSVCVCGFTCQDHVYVDGACKTCGVACPHENGYDAGYCNDCGRLHDHTGEGFENGAYVICGFACSHSGVLKLYHIDGTGYANSRNLLDGNPNSFWSGNHPMHGYHHVIFSLADPSVFSSYTLNAKDLPRKSLWTSWTLSGSHSRDGGWVIIDQVMDTTLELDEHSVSQTFTVEPHIPYTYYRLSVDDIESDYWEDEYYMADITITGPHFHNGACVNCGYRCDTHSYEGGYCTECLLEHDHSGETFTGGKGMLCGYVCPHVSYGNDYKCTLCKQPCSHNFQEDHCQICGFGCSHSEGFEVGYCKRCNQEHDHTGEGYTGGVHTVCGYPCPHTTFGTDYKCTVCTIDCPHEGGHTNGVCDACGKLCLHDTGYTEDGFCNTCEQYESAPQDNSGVHKISNAGQLYWFAEQVSSGNTSISAELTCNIDVSNSPTQGIWIPIAASEAYTGTLDGKGYTVDGIVVENGYQKGFYAYLSQGGVIKNLGLGPNCTVTGFDETGGICGKNEGTIDCCWYLGTVGPPLNHYYGAVDGIAGRNFGTIKNCWFNGKSTNNYVDGICKTNDNFPQNCYFGINGNNSAFASGEVAYNLQQGMQSEELIWGQNLINDKVKDANPVLYGPRVYAVKDCQGNTRYSNTNTDGNHPFDIHGVCTQCGETCDHDYDEFGVCRICGLTCIHGEVLALKYESDGTNMANQQGDMLVDNDIYTYWEGFFGGNGRDYVIFSTDQETVIKSYILTTYTENSNNIFNWRGWSLYGSSSADGNWSLIHRVDDGKLPATNMTPSDPFAVVEHTPYRYFKIVVDCPVHNVIGQPYRMSELTAIETRFENGVCSLCAFRCTQHHYEEGCCTVCGEACQHNGGYTGGYCNTCGLEHDHSGEGYTNGVHTLPCGYPCSHKVVLNRNPVEASSVRARYLLDGNPATSWFSKFGEDGKNYIVFDTGEVPSVIRSYTVTTGDDSGKNSAQNWKNWTLYGRNNDEAWTEIHQARNVIFPIMSNAVSEPFVLDNPTPYRQYMLVVNAVLSSNSDVVQKMADITITGDYFQNGVCSVCDYACDHAGGYADGICTICGKTNAPIVITRQPTNSEVKLGERYCVEVNAKGEGLKYQWYMRNAGAKSFSKSSVTDNTYDDVMTEDCADREVYCVITDAYGNEVTTNTVKLICLPDNEPGGDQESGTGTDGTKLFSFYGTNVSLGNNLDMKFAFSREEAADWSGHYVKMVRSYSQDKDGIIKADDVVRIPCEEWKENGSYYVVIYGGFAAKEMCDKVTVTVYNAADEAVSVTYTTSMREYAMKLYDLLETDQERSVVVDMLNYGAAAQEHFGYGTADLANSRLTDAQRALASEPKPIADRFEGPVQIQSNVNIKSNIQFKLAFTGLTDDMYAVAEFTGWKGDKKTVRMNVSDFVKDDQYQIMILENMVVSDARCMVTVTVYHADGSVYTQIQHSIESYCAQMLSYKPSAVFNAFMIFADSARAYLSNR